MVPISGSEREVFGRQVAARKSATDTVRKERLSKEERFRNFMCAVSQFGFQEATYALTVPIPLTNPTQYVIRDTIGPSTESDVTSSDYLGNMFISSGSLRSTSRDSRAYRGWLYSIKGNGGLTASIRLMCPRPGLSENKILKVELGLIGLSHVLHNEMSQEVIEMIRLRTNARLTAREVAALKWTADGKTARDISKILSISRRTVEYHISSAMTKLGTPTRSSAVIKAHALGLLYNPS